MTVRLDGSSKYLLLSNKVVLCLGELDIIGFLVNAELERDMLLFSFVGLWVWAAQMGLTRPITQETHLRDVSP